MTVVCYRSTDTSAPVINGIAGSLTTALDAILVNGYGSKAAAGWTIAFTATNKRDYKMGGGNQFYIDIDDSGAQTAVGREANLRGYEAMTALNTGTNPFPTTSQIAAPSGQIRKSATADATARPWICCADNKTFYLFIQTGDVANRWDGIYFGDYYSLLSADGYRTCLIMKNTANSGGSQTIDQESTSLNQGGHYYARNIAGAAGAKQFGKLAVGVGGPFNLSSSEAGPQLDGNYYLWSYFIGDTADGRIRGRLRGMWRMVQASEGDTFTGTGDLSSRTFQVLGSVGAGGTSIAVETSDTWDTSS